MIVIHEVLLVAVHEHPPVAVTDTLPLVWLYGADTLVGEMAGEQATPACVTVAVWPAIVTEPIRCVPVGLAAIESTTAPLPLPDAPLVTVIHESALTAVQAQPLTDVTEMLPAVAPDDTDTLVDDRVNVQAGAACVTVNVRPPTVMVADRCTGAVFAATP